MLRHSLRAQGLVLVFLLVFLTPCRAEREILLRFQDESEQRIRLPRGSGELKGFEIRRLSPPRTFVFSGDLVETPHSADGERWTVVARYVQTYPEPKIGISAFGRAGATFAFDFIRIFVP